MKVMIVKELMTGDVSPVAMFQGHPVYGIFHHSKNIVFCHDLYCSLWTAIKGSLSEFDLFLRALSSPQTPHQVLKIKPTKTTKYHVRTT